MALTSTDFSRAISSGARGSFFKILDRARGLGVVAWPRRELAIAHGAKLPAQGLLGDGDTELLIDPLRQIDQAPAHHSMGRRDRAALDHPRNGLALNIVELRGLARRFAVEQAVRAARIEPHHPVPNDLKSDATDLRCLGARRTVIDRCNSQKPPSLRAILCLPRKTAQL